MCGSYNLMCCTPNGPRLDDNCGQVAPRSRIIQGLNTSACDWPYIVSIRSRINNLFDPLTPSNTQHSTVRCAPRRQTGVLADAPSNLLVVAGEYDVTKVDIDSSTRQGAEQYRPIDRCIVHPGYQSVDSLQNFNFNDNNLTNGW
ncbi:hypothetical protein C0Q70_18515 [Pomacea canaliculata]|uniref:Peptidase S1 domain-containing protein n=1 Tax=Pomacea canaliculata TaxID=400727 RepID=A0A2T7NGR2_POMCA|nr:hypothetical protein C0Q70_18515 [Pomacea canaliculata]